MFKLNNKNLVSNKNYKFYYISTWILAVVMLVYFFVPQFYGEGDFYGYIWYHFMFIGYIFQLMFGIEKMQGLQSVILSFSNIVVSTTLFILFLKTVNKYFKNDFLNIWTCVIMSVLNVIYSIMLIYISYIALADLNVGTDPNNYIDGTNIGIIIGSIILAISLIQLTYITIKLIKLNKKDI